MLLVFNNRKGCEPERISNVLQAAAPFLSFFWSLGTPEDVASTPAVGLLWQRSIIQMAFPLFLKTSCSVLFCWFYWLVGYNGVLSGVGV